MIATIRQSNATSFFFFFNWCLSFDVILSREEVEDDFEDFLEEVRNRSIAFRNQYASKEAGLPGKCEAGNLPVKLWLNVTARMHF